MQESRCLIRLTEFSRAGVDLIDRVSIQIEIRVSYDYNFSFLELLSVGAVHQTRMPSTDSVLLPRVQGLQFSASDLQTLDRNCLSLATLNISWKRFATVKALNAENDSVVPSAATVFAHGMLYFC
ncbi:hypothetical protein HanPSC8_Chr05g0222011 [Helianthus annuus]|nr:hypothetical protein HanPSC8_Chr05g0222011 [Helianthus annuus]